MSLFDVVAPAADTVELQGGGKGFQDDLSMALTAGVTGAVISGLGSIYNTAAAGINVLGGNATIINTQEQLNDIDQNWGNYYKANQNTIDVAGFVAGSLIPGTLGIKALNAARAGSGAGAIGRALGFTETMQARSMSAALKEFAVEGGSVFTQINKNKLAAMAWGAADQVLQGAAFETAVALTMKQSPMLADDSWWDIGKSAFVGAAFGGVIGGGIDALILNKSFKNAIAELSGKERKYDYISNLGTKEKPVLGLDTGDRAFAIIDSLLKLPLETLPEDKILDLAFHVGRPDKVAGWNAVTKKIDVDIGDFLLKTRAGAEKNAMNQFQSTLRELAPDSDVATPWVNKLLGDLAHMRTSGATSSDVREQMGTWLHELKSVKAATAPAQYQPGDMWYFKRQLSAEDFAKMGNSLEDWQHAVTRSSPFDTNAYKDPYVFLGTAEQRQQAFKNAAYIGTEGDNGFPTLAAAWKAGRDVAFNADGTIRVNDASKLWRRVDDPVYSAKRFVNVRTGAFTEDTVLTAADTAVSGQGLIINSNSVRIPTKDGAHKLISMGDTIPGRAAAVDEVRTLKNGNKVEVIHGVDPEGAAQIVKIERDSSGKIVNIRQHDADNVLMGFNTKTGWTDTEDVINKALGATFKRKAAKTVEPDTEYFTARHAWASKLQDSELPNKIDVTDFSLMDRLRSVKNPDDLMRIQIVTGETVPGVLRETRGKGERFHGSSNEVKTADFTTDAAFSGSSENIYGMGMYTTEAVDVAEGYTKKGRGKNPTLYTTEQKTPVKLYNMETPLTAETKAMLRGTLGSADVDVSGAKTLREWYDEVRAESRSAGLSRNDVQDIFDSVRTNLEAQGYKGYAHTGGGKTGTKEHAVAIYWNPEQDLSITKTALDKYREAGAVNQKVLGTADQLSIPDVTRGSKLAEAQRLFSDAHAAGTTLDVRAVAYQLNVDAQWLENAVAVRFRENLAGTSVSGNHVIDMAEGVNLPLDSYTRRENLVAEFNRPQQFKELDAITPGMSWKERRDLVIENVKNNGGQFVTGDLAWAYRVQGAVRANKNASSAVLGSEDASQLLELQQDAAKLADSSGAGASFGGASNADYGDILRLWAQDTGKKVHLMAQKAVARVMDTLAPISTKLRSDKQAAAEVGLITNLLRSSDEKYVWKIPGKGGPVAAAADGRMILRELAGVPEDKLAEKIAEVVAEGRRPTIDMINPTAIEFLRTHTTLNAERIERRTLLNNAKGMTSNMDGNVVYVPPIDTTYFQHFAFVRPKADKAFGTSEVTMVFGRDAAELQKRIGMIDNQIYDVVTKKGTEDWFKAKDLYDFDKTINEPRINSELRKTGALSNVYPEVRAETMAEDYIRWHQNQAGRLVRDAVETNYAQQFAEIRKLGESYTEIATSKFAGTTKRTSTEIVNPFDDYLKTALDVSKRSTYQFLHQANEFVDALGVRAYQGLQAAFGDAKKGLLDYNQVNSIAEKLGIKGMYNNAEEYFASNVPRDRNLIKLSINKANMLLANTVLRLDHFNSIVNTVSTPLMLSTELASIKTLASKDPALLGKLMESLTVAVPSDIGPTKGIRVPSTTKLIAKAVENYFGDTGKTLIARYKANGDIKEISDQFHSMIDDLAMRADYKVFGDRVNKAFETGAKFTGNNLAEEFTRFISADVMRQLTEDAVKAGSLSLKEQNAFISVFTNRVQGNYISSQRPIVFQGVLGSAVSLFQTYSFNLMQQLLRHVGNKDKRAVATMFGMQAGLFGLNGTPFFEAVNTHIIGNAAINQGHYDAYSVAPGLLGKEMGDWLMYGTASAMPLIMGGSTPALYTRGDINPRHMTILPMNPLDIPMIDSGRRVVGNILDVASKIAGGADKREALLQGLEHNGINRPLAGFAQVMNGKTTTSKGSLISASSDFDLIANSARILGSRPMDEAVALNNLYRMKAYQAADRDRTEQLGERVKSHLYGNRNIPEEDLERFMLDYVKTGKRAENFYSSLQRWSKNANTSVVEDMRSKLKTSYGQRLNEIMGGTPLPDYRNMQIPIDPALAEGGGTGAPPAGE